MANGITRKSRILEACCCSVEEVRRACEHGAGRIELCEDIAVGGVTPSDELMRDAIHCAAGYDVPVNVLVRPRGGDFVYTEDEVKQMLASIDKCREMGAAGVVIGALTPENDIDLQTMQTLIRCAHGSASEEGSRPLSVTFHRAFDDTKSDPMELLDRIIALGCDRLLTSGREEKAPMAAGLIAKLVCHAAGRIIVMPGSGVNAGNVDEMESLTHATEFHGTKIC